MIRFHYSEHWGSAPRTEGSVARTRRTHVLECGTEDFLKKDQLFIFVLGSPYHNRFTASMFTAVVDTNGNCIYLGRSKLEDDILMSPFITAPLPRSLSWGKRIMLMRVRVDPQELFGILRCAGFEKVNSALGMN